MEQNKVEISPKSINSGINNKVIIATFPYERSPIFTKTIGYHGGVVYELPLLNLSLAKDLCEFDWCAKKLDSFDVVIFSSPNMAKIFFARLEQISVKHTRLDSCYVVTIGAETKRVLNTFGVKVDLCPRLFTSERVVELLSKFKKGSKVLIPCSNKSIWHNSDRFCGTDFRVYTPVLYVNEMNQLYDPQLLERVSQQLFDCMVFTSPSAVEYLSQIYSPVPISSLLTGKVVASIGPTTSEACRQNDVIVSLEPRQSTITSLMWSILFYFESVN